MPTIGVGSESLGNSSTLSARLHKWPEEESSTMGAIRPSDLTYGVLNENLYYERTRDCQDSVSVGQPEGVYPRRGALLRLKKEDFGPPLKSSSIGDVSQCWVGGLTSAKSMTYT